MRYRRITAAIFDIIVLIFITALVFSIWPLSDKIEEKYYEIDEIAFNVKNYTELSQEDQDRIDQLNYEIERELVKYYLIFSVVLIVYFIFIPYKFNNQTIGQKVRKVRLVSDDNITLNVYAIRAILNSGLILTIFFPLFVYICTPIWYSIVALLLTLFQILYWGVSFFMLLVNKRTIHDRITNTKIIEVKR